jgi:hypothetical protein
MCQRRISCAPRTWMASRGGKQKLVFKPLHGFAGRGLLGSTEVGRSRLRRLLKQGDGYVAQRWVPKRCIEATGNEGAALWMDLRV